MAIKKTVYPHSADIARDRGELEAYRESNKINRDCAAAVDKAISDSNYEPFHYDLKGALEKVTAAYGKKRVAWVIAAAVQASGNDGRYSAKNKEWVQNIQIPLEQRYGGSQARPAYYGINAHPTLLDSFINHLREQMAQKKECKPSVTGVLKETAKSVVPAKEPTHKKSKQEEL